MSDLMDDGLMTKQAVQEKCGIWVKSQGQFCGVPSTPVKNELDNYDSDEFIDTDSEFDSVSECGTKKRRIIRQRKYEKLNLICEWKDCIFNTESIEKFVDHVSRHMPELPIKKAKDGSEYYVCPWKNCNYENSTDTEIMRHVNYHSYHTKLKCYGAIARSKTKLPKCKRQYLGLSIFDITKPQVCFWNDCLAVFNNYQFFVNHVRQHIENENPHGNHVKGGVKCQWDCCQSNCPSIYKLSDHIRCHTKEKVVACPDCGSLFASNTKFHDHCRRQISIEVQGFQCSYCLKFYPTEKFLREHVKFHVFKYKCNKCEMSCESKAGLVKHITYRHSSSRPFRCEFCSHSAKSLQDLDSHMTVHTKGPNFSCAFENCTYTCKTSYTFDRHIERYHCAEERWYCCHECPSKYRRGYNLTKHLISEHQLQWPTGHKRFIYMRDDDGFYRLQKVRYECIEENNEISGLPQDPNEPEKEYKIKIDKSSTNYKIEVVEDTFKNSNGDDGDKSNIDPDEPNEFDDNKINNYIEKHETNNDDDENSNNHDNLEPRSMPVISNILISIDQMDHDGNIIDSKFIETQETDQLPNSEQPFFILT